jgi:hypothetical protein
MGWDDARTMPYYVLVFFFLVLLVHHVGRSLILTMYALDTPLEEHFSLLQ